MDKDDVLVGVTYFAGWWEPLPNKWHVPADTDWRPLFPERVPLLGEYNDQETMNREIIAASEHGIDFFITLWYYNEEGEEREPNSRFLERGLTKFVASPEAHRMQFMIEYCNHPPYTVETEAHWEECIDTWLEFFAHPSHLRIDDKLVFKVHSFHFFIQESGGIEEGRQRLERLREAVRDAGLGEMLIGAGVMSQEAVGEGHPATELFDFTGTYMDVPQLEPKDEDYPYEMLAEQSEQGRRIHAEDAIPYVPYLAAGWNPRPWRDPRPAFELPNREQWTAALEKMKADVLEHDMLGFPGQNAFIIYAWNEYGEGGFIAPTEGDGYMKLEAIQEVFD